MNHDNYIVIDADNCCSAFGGVASYVLLHHRARLTEIYRSGKAQKKLDEKFGQVNTGIRYFVMDGAGAVLAAGSRQHAESYMRPTLVFIERMAA